MQFELELREFLPTQCQGCCVAREVIHNAVKDAAYGEITDQDAEDIARNLASAIAKSNCVGEAEADTTFYPAGEHDCMQPEKVGEIEAGIKQAASK